MKYCLTIRYEFEEFDDIAARLRAKAKLILMTGRSVSETDDINTKVKLQEITENSAPRHVNLNI